MTSQTTKFNHSPFRLKIEDLLLALVALAPAATVIAAFILRLAPEWVYPLGKSLMIIVPTLWILIDRWSWRDVIDRWTLRFCLRDILWGFGTGLTISLAILALYALFFRHRLNAEGIVSTLPAYLIGHFWLSALGVSFANSLLEEYFWRAFLLERTAVRLGWKKAAILNGLIFGVHHWFLLRCFFPPFIAAILTFGTIVGGWIWSAMRMKDLSIWSCYLSHIMADLAVITAGYFILFN